MVDMVHRLQDTICDAIAAHDGTVYREDSWTREEGGGGRSGAAGVAAVASVILLWCLLGNKTYS